MSDAHDHEDEHEHDHVDEHEQDFPTTKAELLERIRAGREEWDALLAGASDEQLTASALPNGHSIKDVMAHIAAYERWTAAQIRGASSGTPPTNMELYDVDELPPGPEIWDMDWQNAAIHEHYRDRPLAEVRQLARDTHDALIAAIEPLSDEEMATPGAQAWQGEDSLLRIIPGQTYAHYQMHLDDARTAIS
ncbi:MAG: ClbS/DfsB family four-helix bundle protein [Chloroflexota bacterium]|nr:ClbS/DfsB family four-helix bundle protein [Chloroflexota bacterium]